MILTTVLYVVLILGACSPAIWLLSSASTPGQRTIAVLLLATSLVAYMGLEFVKPAM